MYLACIFNHQNCIQFCLKLLSFRNFYTCNLSLKNAIINGATALFTVQCVDMCVVCICTIYISINILSEERESWKSYRPAFLSQDMCECCSPSLQVRGVRKLFQNDPALTPSLTTRPRKRRYHASTDNGQISRSRVWGERRFPGIFQDILGISQFFYRISKSISWYSRYFSVYLYICFIF